MPPRLGVWARASEGASVAAGHGETTEREQVTTADIHWQPPRDQRVRAATAASAASNMPSVSSTSAAVWASDT